MTFCLRYDGTITLGPKAGQKLENHRQSLFAEKTAEAAIAKATAAKAMFQGTITVYTVESFDEKPALSDNQTWMPFKSRRTGGYVETEIVRV